MANVKTSNTMFLDTAGSFTANSYFLIYHLIFSSATGTATMTLEDGNGSKKLVLEETGNTTHIDLSDRPMKFEGGIEVAAVNNLELTVVYEEK